MAADPVSRRFFEMQADAYLIRHACGGRLEARASRKSASPFQEEFHVDLLVCQSCQERILWPWLEIKPQ